MASFQEQTHRPRAMAIGRAGTIASLVEDGDLYVDAKEWINPSPPEEDHYARQFLFGDFHADTHHFIEQAKTRGPKEILCAASASALVSPLVSIIDKCLVQDITGTSQFMRAVSGATKEMFLTPGKFFGGLSFRLTFAVYFGTYAVANLSELALDMKKITDDETRKTSKVAASGVANIGLLAWRDSTFARVYSKAVPHSTPMRTLGLFATRDMLTMYATFYMAPVAAEHLEKNHGWDTNVAELSTALAIPAAMQIITAPLHIHAMDYYAKPSVSSSAERWAVIKNEFKTVSFARSFRILPAFGIGSFGNNKFRELFIRQENEELLLSRRITRAYTQNFGT
jgi:hypothetical protein